MNRYDVLKIAIFASAATLIPGAAYACGAPTLPPSVVLAFEIGARVLTVYKFLFAIGAVAFCTYALWLFVKYVGGIFHSYLFG